MCHVLELGSKIQTKKQKPKKARKPNSFYAQINIKKPFVKRAFFIS